MINNKLAKYLLLNFLSVFLFACGGGQQAPIKNINKDTVSPTISITGASEVSLKRNSPFTDNGATAIDNVDGDLTQQIVVGGDIIDTSISGTYHITYDVMDDAQNSAAQEIRTVIIEEDSFLLVNMHYALLQNQGMIWGELDGIIEKNVTKLATKGSNTIKVSNLTSLMKDQLITYLGTNKQYYVGQIKTLKNPDEIILFKPLESDLKKGSALWDFYDNGSHAHIHGFKAIADFSLKELKFDDKTTGVHLLLGDSWFDDGTIHSRLIKKLPNATIINQGIGGDTTQNLLDRFDRDVTPNAPNYVWIISGTNDYWQGVSTKTFKTNLEKLIKKSKAIGAKVIIIDSSVGEGTAPSTGIKNQKQSEEYVRVTKELL